MRMQRISRAPVLSATRSRVSGWTIAYLARSTISVRRQRLVALVVRVQRGRLADGLLVHAVLATGVDAHDERLRRPVGYDDALAHARTTAPPALVGAHLRRLLRRPGGGSPLSLARPARPPLARVRAPALLALPVALGLGLRLSHDAASRARARRRCPARAPRSGHARGPSWPAWPARCSRAAPWRAGSAG